MIVIIHLYAKGLFEVKLFIVLLGGNGVETLHHDLAHSWLGTRFVLHRHKLQKPMNTNSPGSHGPKIIKLCLTNIVYKIIEFDYFIKALEVLIFLF